MPTVMMSEGISQQGCHDYSADNAKWGTNPFSQVAASNKYSGISGNLPETITPRPQQPMAYSTITNSNFPAPFSINKFYQTNATKRSSVKMMATKSSSAMDGPGEDMDEYWEANVRVAP